MSLNLVEKNLQVENLANLLNISYVHALGTRGQLRFMAEEHYPIGEFGEMQSKEFATRMEWKEDPDDLILALLQSQILFKDEQGLRMSDWTEGDPSWFGFSRWIRNDREVPL